jgi:hypothetical protein
MADKKREFVPLSVTHPEIAKEAFGWDSSSVSSGSDLKREWRCKLSHIWTASVSGRTSGRGCPICAGKKVLAGFNDLKSVDPETASQANGWNPETVSPNSGKKLSWKCSVGHEWIAVVSNRFNGRTGCPFCTGQKVLSGFNDFKTICPEIADEAVGWDPSSVHAGSKTKKLWKCKKNHEWMTAPSQRRRGRGCPYCSGNIVAPGFNDLATVFPEVAAEAHGWDPSKSMKVSGVMKEWKCSEGHIYEMTIANRVYDHACPVCSGRKVLIGTNDLLTLRPDIAREADNWDPTSVTPGSNRKKKWICCEGHRWISTVNDRTQGHGCPSCANSGFDPNKDGWLYFLEHSAWEMLQIGITNSPDDRLSTHKRLGWEILELRGPMDGHLTRQWETGILRMLKAKGANLSNSEIAGKFDGYSEAWSKETLFVESIKDLMRLTEEWENS